MKNRQAFIIGLLTVLIFDAAAAANAANWTVTKFTNSNDNVCDADCSLREAVFNAQSGDTVVFDSNLFGQQFTLGGSEIVITKRIIIDGALDTVRVAFISGENTSRIFLIEAGGALDLRNAILVQGNGGSGYENEKGGAIYAKQSTALSLDRVAVRGNNAPLYGGAILTIGASVHFVNSSFTTNTATSCLAMSLIESSVKMANVTISGNSDNNTNDFDDLGPVCLSDSDTIIRNSTIANNYSGRNAVAVLDYPNATPSTLSLGNTIVTANTFSFGGDIDNFYNTSSIISTGGNLIGSTFQTAPGTFTQPNDATSVNPLLAPTNSNQGGFPVVSHPLQAGSPALNTGLNANAVDPLTNQPLTTDTRGAGFPRIAGGTVDKGAFEDQTNGFSLVVTKKTNSNDFVCDDDCSLREAVYQASVHNGTDTITFANNVFGSVSLGGTEILIQNQNVNIVGYPNLNANYLTVSGGNANRIFHLNNATANI